MKRILMIQKAFILFAIVSFVTSCSSDDDGGNKSETEADNKYVVGFQAFPVGDAEPVDYLLSLESLDELTSGEISVEGQGTPLKGWRFFHGAGNTFFTAGYSDDDKCIAYQLNENGVVAEKANFEFESTLDNFSAIDDNTLLAVELSYAGTSDKRFHIVNAETGLLEKVVEHPIDIEQGSGTEGDPGYIPWVTGMVLRDGKLFVSYHKWDAIGYYTTPDVGRAYVAVFKYPEFELENIIYDERTSPIGVNGHSTGLEKTESGDIYSYSSSSLISGFTEATKPSGILRIKNGETTFDPDYFFDIEAETSGKKVFLMDYVGNGKAIARLIADDTGAAWSAFVGNNNDVFTLAVIDLENKTVTDISGVPTHGHRYTGPMFIEDGKVYISCSTADETHVYVVDPETATATKGAKVLGMGLKTIYKLTK